MFGFQHVTRAGDDEQIGAVGDDQHRLQIAQVFVHAPVFCQLYRRAGKLTRHRLKLFLQSFQQGKGIGGGACKTGHHIMASGRQPTHFAG